MTDPKSTHTSDIEQTIRDMHDSPNMPNPLGLENVIECLTRLPFNVTMYYNKIDGLWRVSNFDMDNWPKNTSFFGVNFYIVDITLAQAIARAVHYYYHTKLKD